MGGLIWNPNTGQFESYDLDKVNGDAGNAEYLWESLPQQDKAAPQKSAAACNHEWQTYHGLRESFDYCKLCDVKRSL